MKAIAYIRVSTLLQATEGVSLEAQEAKIKLWCAANDAELAGVFVDAGISGKRSDNRPQLQAALEAALEAVSAGSVLVVYSLSRLARSTKDTLAISDRLQKANCDLVSLSEKIDTTTAAGKMVFRMLAVLAEFERDQISERVSTVVAHKRSKGERIGQVPFGYDLAEDGVRLITNDAEQSILEDIRELRASGLSLRDIATQLNTLKLPTKKGGEWKHSTVQSILGRVAA